MAERHRALLVLPGTILLPGETLRLPSGGPTAAHATLTLRHALDTRGTLLLGATPSDGRDGSPVNGLLPVAVLARVEQGDVLEAGTSPLVLHALERVALRGIVGDTQRLRARFAEIEEGDPALARLTDQTASALGLSYAERARLLTATEAAERVGLLEEMRRARAEAGPPPPPPPGPFDREERHQRDVQRFQRQLRELELPASSRRVLTRDVDHLRHAAPDSAEAARARSHLQWTLELPWGPAQDEPGAPPFRDVAKALSRSHVGLVEVKRRIGEILAIRELGGGARGTVLCFQGPPGTGKSSMARAVAAAMGRPFLAIPVGAMLHERELVGASRRERGSPGAILSGLHRCGSNAPVILLDEIDKVALGGEGTASGALLLLLDPEHNGEFYDHYLGVPFDLSRCLFLATANEVDELPDSLLDRMELLSFRGYTEGEKLQIARRHLLPRAREHAGIGAKALDVSPGALRTLIRSYTEEPGVRQLQRQLVSLARKAAVDVVAGGSGLVVRQRDVAHHLGPRTVEEEVRLARPTIGCATGLAWTSIGGALLPIEALAMPGSGRMILTGQIGEVMRESVQTALSYLRGRFQGFGLSQNLLDELDLHLHFPAAATPKDGPSGGIAIATALVSLFLRRPARHTIAMTGEMSLHGAVLPVGGLREKLLAAIRCGIPEVIVPARNAQDVLRLSVEIRERVKIHLVDDVQQVLELAILHRSAGGLGRGPRAVAHKRAARQARGKRKKEEGA